MATSSRVELTTASRPNDVREGGRWSFGQRLKNDLVYAVITAAIATVGWLPRSALRRIGVGLGVLAHALVPSARRIARANVARVMPAMPERERRALIARVYRTLGEHLGDAVAMLDARRPVETLPFAPGARETLEAALAEGRGVLFASAHLGPWERVAATIVEVGLPFAVVAREAYDPRLTRLYERLRSARGLATIYRGASGSGTALLRALRRGAILGVPMDLASRVPSIEVPFLGIPAATPVGPARLALRTRAAVVVAAATPSPGVPGGLALAIQRIDVGDLRTAGSGPEAERALTARINEAISAAILAMPEGWVWMHPRFS
ncbi:MAG: lysophospholipid acyltransferase family protein [Deltaproteobacteria bacterium]|nr:lysophospholipid acyltransferase family protein [Deltaproteobacteria bacterium]